MCCQSGEIAPNLVTLETTTTRLLQLIERRFFVEILFSLEPIDGKLVQRNSLPNSLSCFCDLLKDI